MAGLNLFSPRTGTIYQHRTAVARIDRPTTYDVHFVFVISPILFNNKSKTSRERTNERISFGSFDDRRADTEKRVLAVFTKPSIRSRRRSRYVGGDRCPIFAVSQCETFGTRLQSNRGFGSIRSTTYYRYNAIFGFSYSGRESDRRRPARESNRSVRNRNARSSPNDYRADGPAVHV